MALAQIRLVVADVEGTAVVAGGPCFVDLEGAVAVEQGSAVAEGTPAAVAVDQGVVDEQGTDVAVDQGSADEQGTAVAAVDQGSADVEGAVAEQGSAAHRVVDTYSALQHTRRDNLDLRLQTEADLQTLLVADWVGKIAKDQRLLTAYLQTSSVPVQNSDCMQL